MKINFKDKIKHGVWKEIDGYVSYRDFNKEYGRIMDSVIRNMANAIFDLPFIAQGKIYKALWYRRLSEELIERIPK